MEHSEAGPGEHERQRGTTGRPEHGPRLRRLSSRRVPFRAAHGAITVESSGSTGRLVGCGRLAG
jgi:hypothetical protein